MATNNACNFNTGNITEVLTSNGTPNAPTFQAGGGGGGGGLQLIQTQNAAAVTDLPFTVGITGTYNNYLVIYDNINFPASTGTQTLLVQLSTDGGATYINAGYYAGIGLYVSGISTLATATAIASGLCPLHNLTSGSGYILSSGEVTSFIPPSTVGTGDNGSAYLTPNIVVNALNFTVDSTNPFSGTISLYGYSQ